MSQIQDGHLELSNAISETNLFALCARMTSNTTFLIWGKESIFRPIYFIWDVFDFENSRWPLK